MESTQGPMKQRMKVTKVNKEKRRMITTYCQEPMLRESYKEHLAKLIYFSNHTGTKTLNHSQYLHRMFQQE